MGESGSHDGDRTKLLGGKPGFTNGGYDPTDLYSSEAYDTTALNALGHCCNPLSNSTSPNETSLAIVSAGAMSGSDITGFQNTYPYLATNWQQFFIDGRATAPDIEGTLDVEWSRAMANSLGASANTAKIYIYEAFNSNPSYFTAAYNVATRLGKPLPVQASPFTAGRCIPTRPAAASI
jgi:hypothetical protein